MRKLMFEIAYKGSRYHGYQVQENALSVAEVLQDAIERVFKKREDIVGCSRTDTGVHANQYFFHMNTSLKIPTNAAVIALNHQLPPDVAILSCTEVSADFHARYDVEWKEYRYKIWNSEVKNPFLENLAFSYKYPLDAEKMNRIAKEFIGTHDFRGFSSTGSNVKSTVRTIFDCRVERIENLVEFTIKGNGFLYNMVRIMVGTLLLVPQGRLSAGGLSEILASGDRERAGITAPAAGLYLNQVFYNPAKIRKSCDYRDIRDEKTSEQ